MRTTITFLLSAALLCAAPLATPAVAQDSLDVAKVGELLLHTGHVYGVAVAGGHAYLACELGLVITTAADPVQLQGVCFLPDAAHGVAVSGDYAYVADHQEGLRVVDISDPAHPQEVGSYDTPGFALAVTLSGNHAYVADEYTGLQVIEITDPPRCPERRAHRATGCDYGGKEKAFLRPGAEPSHDLVQYESLPRCSHLRVAFQVGQGPQV